MRRKSSPQFLVRTHIVRFVLFLLFVCAIRWSWDAYQTNQRAKHMIGEMQQKQHLLEKRLSQIKTRNELLDTPTGQQDFLIEKYAVHRPGERVLVLVQDDTLKTRQEIPVKEDTWWQRFIGVFY